MNDGWMSVYVSVISSVYVKVQCEGLTEKVCHSPLVLYKCFH